MYEYMFAEFNRKVAYEKISYIDLKICKLEETGHLGNEALFSKKWKHFNEVVLCWHGNSICV